MQKVSELFRRRGAEGDIGVEIELEGHRLPQVHNDFWRSEHDGSLRGEAMEYVLANPLPHDKVEEALNNLSQCFKEANSKFEHSGRAGVHIHVNCQDLTIVELYNFMTLYLILEDVLVHWCGEGRVGNLFCLRAKDAEYLLYCLTKALEDGKWRMRFGTDELRYASMNVVALCRYGSLEFRAMRSTEDMELINTWAQTLYQLKQFAKGVESPEDLIYQVSAGGEEAFVNQFLPYLAKEVVQFDNWQGMIVEGMRNAQEVAFAGDWEQLKKGPRREIGGIEVEDGWDDDFPPIDF